MKFLQKYVNENIFVFFLLQIFLPLVCFGQQYLRVHIPDGWVNITDKAAKSDTEGIPDKLVRTAENHVCKILAADPKTFNDSAPIYLLQIRVPQMDDFKLSDSGLNDLVAGTKISVKSRQGASLVEDKILTVAGVKIFRSIVEMPVPGAGDQEIQVRIIQYYLPDGDGAAAISFYVPKSKAGAYMPLIEDSISKTLKPKSN